jgi:cellulose synthase/poly-beta-1,6-N-acetylglucosamine synthase-like glycosyltransferase
VHHLRRERGGQGKSHTLNHGIDRILREDWAEAVLIMDADVLFEKSALRKMARHLSDPAIGAVTAYIKEGTLGGNYLTRFVAFEYLTAQAGSRRAQNIFGALACLAGGAQLHSRENLLAIGGAIDTSSLAEDTVTTFTTQMLGRGLVFEGNAVVWAEEPGDVAALWKQRLRWGRGNVQVSLQFASIWGRGRAFRWLTLLPFSLLWFTVLLMPLLMLGSAVGLIGLYLIDAPLAARAFTLLWVWHAVVWLFGTLMAFSIDPATARRSWLEGILFPGLVSVGIMIYTAFPAPIRAASTELLAHYGARPTAAAVVALRIFVYAWCFACVPVAYLAKVCAERPRWRWLTPGVIYVAGYGPLLCAATVASYFKELRNAAAIWDKTVKVGRVGLPIARGGRAA